MNASRPVENIARGSARIARGLGPALWPGERSEAVARWILLGLVGSVAVTALSVHRWLMWIALGVGLFVAHQAGRSPEADTEPDVDDEQPEEWHPDDVIELVWELVGDRKGVHLSTLRTALEAETSRAWTPADVRALLASARVPVRDGVRVRGVGNTTGVHRDDLPPLPSPAPPPGPVGVVDAGQDANANTNNAVTVEQQEGMTIIRDAADLARHHTAKAPWTPERRHQ